MYNNKMHVMTEGALIRLVYDMAPGEVIRRFDNGMLSNNSIGGIVSFSVSYDNGNTRLIYSLNVRPALASMLRQNMTKNTVLSIFRNIAAVMENSQLFMLSERNFVLDPRYIFVDSSDLSVEMIYVPTNDVCGVYLGQFIKTCITLGVFDTSVDSSYLTQLLNFVNTHSDMSASGLRKLIDDMMNDKTPSPQPRQPAPAAQPVRPAAVAKSAVQAVGPAPESTPAQPSAAKNKNGLFGSLLNRSKEAAPAQNAASPAPAAKPVKQPKQVQTAPGFSGIAIPGADQLIIDGKQQERKAAMPAVPCLVDKNGRSIPVSGSPFWIGKSRQSQIVNSLVIDGDAGVSKNHAYIENVNGKYYIVDPKSTNGTFINGKMIAKNTRTELKDGIKIGIWKEEFIFRVK